MYRVFKQLESGEWEHVALSDQLEQATELVATLSTTWPGEYLVDSEENDIELPERPRFSSPRPRSRSSRQKLPW